MSDVEVESGFDCVGPLPWGSHLCQFYQDGPDLRDTLLPYFLAGLERNEACLWVAAPPFGVDDATGALRAATPDLSRRMATGQVEIVDSRDWYLIRSRFDTERVLASWTLRSEAALDRGFDGLRIAANTFWGAAPEAFKHFTDYEQALRRWFDGRRVVCLCSYCLPSSSAEDVLDVVRCHEFALARREGEWEIVESAALKTAKERLRRANEELESNVAERTQHLRRALADKEVLLKEIHHRVKNNLQLISSLLMLRGAAFADSGCGEVLEEMLRRIHAIGLVHERLYLEEDSHRIDFGAYLTDLARSLATSYAMEDRVVVRVTASETCLSLNAAVPLSLIATEVMTNALKYAFPDGRSGAIDVRFADRGPEGSLLEIRDNGVGLTAGSRSGVGLGLVRRLAGQLNGEVSFEDRGGASFSLRLPPAPEA
jgi:two-component sensor histidine kinase